MTRQQLFDIAEAFGLTLATERVTAGPEAGAAFRMFEFDGPNFDALKGACAAIRAAWQVTGSFCIVRPSDIDGTRYLHIESFWCEPAAV